MLNKKKSIQFNSTGAILNQNFGAIASAIGSRP